VSRAPLLVQGCGMATAVGLTAPASCAAIRARLDGFRETRFMARGGAWIVGAEVPLDEPWRGLPRLARLVAGPIRECLDSAPEVAPEDIPLLLGVAEPTRPGRLAGLEQELLPLVLEALQERLHPAASRLIPMGRVSGAVGIREAAKLVNEKGFGRVIVGGVDSHLVAATLAAFDERDRLLTERNTNGFVPGEAGAAVLVGPADGRPGLRIRSLGLAVERATIEGEEPLRGEGLAAAYRQALDAARLGLHEIDYRIADLSGEQYWFKEAALAEARVMRVRRGFQDIWQPADCVGEIGAAATPCLLGVAWWAARKAYAPGPLALAQASNDDGRRIAMVLDGAGAA
jgi:3-oxoacyl-[acyl-carrier-protein] synthase I